MTANHSFRFGIGQTGPLLRIALVYAILLVPTIAPVRVEDMLVAIFLIGFPFFTNRFFRIPRQSLLLFSVFAYITFASYAQIGLTSVPLIFGDLLELIRPVRFFAFIVLGATIFGTPDEKRTFTWFLLTGTLIAIVLAFLQSALVNIVAFEPAIQLTESYAGNHVIPLQRRSELVGTNGNPNSFIALLSPGMFVSVAILLAKDAPQIHRSQRSLSALVACSTLVAAVVTRSRIGMLLLITGIALTGILVRSDFKTTLLGIMTVPAGYGILVIGSILRILPKQYVDLINPLQARAVQIRFDIWTQLLEASQVTVPLILLGHGSQELFIREFRAVDSGWIQFFYHYGFIGTGLLSIAAIVMFAALTRAANNQSGFDRVVAVGGATTLLGFGLMMVTANPWKDLQLMALLGIMVGSGLSRVRPLELVYSRPETTLKR